MSRSHAVSRSTEVDLTRTAERQLRALRGRRLKAAVRFLEELMAGGCAQAGYRLAGAGVLDHLCCRHLYGSDRGIVAWPSLDAAVVIAIGPHDQSVNDIYQLILAALEIDMPEAERQKPPCCDDLDEPPADPETAELIAAAIDALRRRSRRR